MMQDKISTILPVELDIAMYGASLLMPGDIVRVDYLPKRYRELVYFQVMQISQTVNETSWMTKLKLQFRVKKSEKQKIGGNVNLKDVFIEKKLLEDLELYDIDRWMDYISKLRPHNVTFNPAQPRAWSYIFKFEASETSKAGSATNFETLPYFARSWEKDNQAIKDLKTVQGIMYKEKSSPKAVELRDWVYPWINPNGDQTESNAKLLEGNEYLLMVSNDVDYWTFLPADATQAEIDIISNYLLVQEQLDSDRPMKKLGDSISSGWDNIKRWCGWGEWDDTLEYEN